MSSLDQPALRLLNDHRALAPVLRAAARASGKPYIQTYDEFARAAGSDGGTARDVMRTLGADPAAVAGELVLLEQAAAVRRDAHQRVATLRTLEQSAPVDPGALVTPHAEVSRFAQANRLTARYAGPEGFAKFKHENTQAALAGRDLVAELRGPVTTRTAEAAFAELDGRIERAIESAEPASVRLRMLSEARTDGLRALDGQLETARRTLDQAPAASPPTAGGGGLRMLDQASGSLAERQHRFAMDYVAGQRHLNAGEAYMAGLRLAETEIREA